MVSQKKPASTAGPSRGGAISKRRSAARTDRDGDVSMGTTAGARGGGISKAKPKAGAKAAAPRANAERGARPSRLNSERAQREILNHVNSGAAPRRGAPSTNRQSEELRVTGWRSSKAASNDDGGINSLVAWLEKKSTLKNGANKRAVKIKKSHVEGDDLLLTVKGEDVASLLRLDGWVFAGTNIKIERASAQDLTAPAEGATKESTMAMLTGVLARRYNLELKLLDLSALGQDPDLKASAIFDSRSTTSKFFPALMKVLDSQFESSTAKHEAIQSVTLASNDLVNVAPVTTLAQTLPHLKNLDISNNNFKDLAAIDVWRRKFSKLDHLIIAPNPLVDNEPDYAAKVLNWYPKLRLLNSVQVRTDEEAMNGVQVSDLPFPIRGPCFQDDGQIAENFLRNFFAGYDTDRAAVASHYYDAQSDFSLAVNTQAPRDPNSSNAPQAQEWDLYIKRSRNLKKIQQLPARQARVFHGPQAIAEVWATLPSTRHPDLAAEAKKWSIECHIQSGVPDPTGASPAGVDGFIIIVHGEFGEIDVSTNEVKKTRSFDRVFTIGPGGPSGVRVVNDLLTVRAYGGHQAFEPEDSQQQAVTNGVEAVVPGLPAGLAPEVAEQMLLELQKRTSMVVGYAKDCLDQVQWDFDRALQTFESVKTNLPAEAFAVPPQA